MDTTKQTNPADSGLNDARGEVPNGSPVHLPDDNHSQNFFQTHDTRNLNNLHTSHSPCAPLLIHHCSNLHAPPSPCYLTAPPQSRICEHPQQIPGPYLVICLFGLRHHSFQSGPGDYQPSIANFQSYPGFMKSNHPPNTPNSVMAPAHTFFDDPDPNDLYRTSTRPCQMAHRYYLRWIHTVYRPEISPLFFVQEWCAALEGVRAQFGPFCLLDIIIFNQFLTAVAFNPQAHAWVDSIHVPMDNMLPPTLMDQVYVDFLVFESHRMHLPLVPLSYECVPACIPEGERIVKHYCPFHQVLGLHSMEDCSLHPMRKPNGKVRDTANDNQEQT